MMSKQGVWMLGALALVAGCYGSNGQTKDGQSHWLELCDEASDCDGGELCACGVCTIRCDVSADCGARSTCASTDEHAACADAPGNIEVCLGVCEIDDDCVTSGVECERGECVAALAVVPDRVIEGGVDADVADSSMPDDAGDSELVQTSEGLLSCSDIRAREAEKLGPLADAYGDCETEVDCTCAAATTECSPRCAEPIARPLIEEFRDVVALFDNAYCSDPSLHGACGYLDVDCGPCTPVCIAGKCSNTNRTPCETDLGCPEGLICHIDGTCMGRGVEDENGVATLAVSSDDVELGAGYESIPAFVVTDREVIWVDAGTTNDDGAFQDDAAVYRLALGDDVPEVLSGGLLAGMLGMAYDATHVYYTTWNGVWSVPRAGGAEPFRVINESIWEWILHDGYLFYEAGDLGGGIRRVGVDGEGDMLYYDHNGAGSVRGFAASGERLFVEISNGEDETDLYELIAPLDAELIAPGLRSVGDVGPLLASNGLLLTDYGDKNGFHFFNVEDSSSGTLADDTWLDMRSTVDGAVYYASVATRPGDTFERYFIERMTLDDNVREQLRVATKLVGQIVARDGYLYWVENRRLLRKAL